LSRASLRESETDNAEANKTCSDNIQNDYLLQQARRNQDHANDRTKCACSPAEMSRLANVTGQLSCNVVGGLTSALNYSGLNQLSHCRRTRKLDVPVNKLNNCSRTLFATSTTS